MKWHLPVVPALIVVLTAACGSSDPPRSDDDDDGSSSGGGTVTSSGGNGGSGGMGAGGMGAGGTGAGGTGGATGKPSVIIDTSLGTMTIELEPELMPITTTNFLAYVDDGFYDGTIIHRVIPDFVIQGGGFTSGMTNKPPTYAPITLETSAEIPHDYGVISMARTSDPNSATSQFFVVNGAAGAPSLDGAYAAFGRLTSGSEALDAISAVTTGSVGQFQDVPTQDVTVLSITRAP